MNRRGEPRFQVNAPAKLTPLDDPERELDCILVDISGSGMKLVLSEELVEGQMISVEVGQHMVLADVRHCTARGSKFAIGVEKVHVMLLGSEERNGAKATQIQLLLDDYHLRIRRALECMA
ncbi:MAG: PilZ domain-containing protein [Acidobacteriia bacterium]|nr:PilZ domain-containing protein [Terriglobia bacterium]